MAADIFTAIFSDSRVSPTVLVLLYVLAFLLNLFSLAIELSLLVKLETNELVRENNASDTSA